MSEVGLSLYHILAERKSRGAFYTPRVIADYLADWAIADRPDASVLDPTCGEGVFLAAATQVLQGLGVQPDGISAQVFGIDIDPVAVDISSQELESAGAFPSVINSDFFTIPSPSEMFSELGPFDAVIGNPPFVRYHLHVGAARKVAAEAALRQGVRVSGLASSWAPILVHAGSFLKPDGRLAMVVPAELLTVGYAEPIRRWLRQRFAAVTLVFFERLQFDDATEDTVLLLARGKGGCDAFSLLHVADADDLRHLRAGDGFGVTPAEEGKWTDFLVPMAQRQLFRRVVSERFVNLAEYGAPELGTVTGANGFFTLSEVTRQQYALSDAQVTPISPPGTKHLRGLAFTKRDWEELRDRGEAVWMLWPDADDTSPELARYLAEGQHLGIPDAYKCQIRSPWWRPPRVSAPDIFFTYMSHRYPRLVANKAAVSFLNSMHGVRLQPGVSKCTKEALPLLALNSVTMLGAEIYGRSYGGGILKMEPSEAATLPVPAPSVLDKAWSVLRSEKASLDNQLRNGRWTNVVARVDEVLLRTTLGLNPAEAEDLNAAARTLRGRRLGRARAGDSIDD